MHYLYAAFSLKSDGEGLSAIEQEAVDRWRKAAQQAFDLIVTQGEAPAPMSWIRTS